MTELPSYQEQGLGPALIFLHGIGGDRCSFDAQLPYFADRFRSIAWDMPGYGDSPLRAEMTFDLLAASLARLLDHLQEDRAIVVGHSMGGMVAQSFAARYPERLTALVLAGTSAAFGRPGSDFREKFLASRLAPLDQGQRPADFADGLIATMFGDFKDPAIMAKAAGSMKGLKAESYRAALNCIVTFDEFASLPRIPCPTLCLAAEKDAMAPPRTMEKMAAKIPGGRFASIDGAGHLMNAERADEFNRLLDEFFETLA